MSDNIGRVLDTDKTRRTLIEAVWKDMIREEKSLCPCNRTQREEVTPFTLEDPCLLHQLPFVAVVVRAEGIFRKPLTVSVLLLRMIKH